MGSRSSSKEFLGSQWTTTSRMGTFLETLGLNLEVGCLLKRRSQAHSLGKVMKVERTANTDLLSRKVVMALFFQFLWLAFLASCARASDVTSLLDFLRGVHQGQNGCLVQTWASNRVDSAGCPDNWCGVTCNTAGQVIALELPGEGLQGTIMPNTLGNLPMLTFLDLSSNLLTGSLPDDLGNLSNLQRMDLSHNLLNGSIPDTFNGLRNLANLSLAGNLLYGSIPSSLSALRLLTSLNLSINSLGGTIPRELSDLPGLTELDLHNNQLYGQLDPAFLSLPSLKSVDLSSNRLSGFVPWQPNDTLPLLKTVEYVNLSNNQLSGPLAPPIFSSLFAYKLQVLDMSNNQLNGDLPDFEYVINLVTLRLRNNLFTGAVPLTLLSGTLGLLEELDVSSNNLTGEIGHISSTSLKVLNLSSNLLSGAIPQKVGSCITVDLSYNKFYGDLSSMLYWSDVVEVVDLSFNDLSGELPDIVSRLVRLTSLNVSHNTLLGSIPSNYGFLEKLSAIDLSFNKLNGSIPGSFFNSSTVAYLSLSNNLLVGSLLLQDIMPLPPISPSSSLESPSQMSQIIVMDLSNNKLAGSISEDINRFQKLKELDLSGNNLSGHIPNSLQDLTLLQNLDLSGNFLTGSIPEALPNTLLVLHLANNDLSGLIPENLRRFSNASFFPGNEGLTAPWFSPSGQKSPLKSSAAANRKGIGTAVKAGLIGGCSAGFVLVVFVGWLLYKKSLSKTKDYGRGSDIDAENKDIGKGHKMWSPCAAYFDADRVPPEMNISADLLLVPGKTSPASKYRGSPQEAKNPWAQAAMMETEDSSKLIGMEMSPSRARQKSSPESNSYHGSVRVSEEFLPTESPIALKVRSPDRLAGDLHLLDNSLRFTAEELSRAPAEVLGRSSHGTSYKAALDNGHVLTVKWLREGLAKGKKEFAREAKKFGKVRHPNLIPLRGYYWGPREHEKLIISDFMILGSLAAVLSDRAGQKQVPLSWRQRLVIAVDIARGLVYLHAERHLPHGNLKATNVLIDGPTFNARLGDYCLHQLMTSEGTANQILNAGALGYRAPELATMRKPKPSLNGDVYAFGVLMMELLTGKGAGDIISGQSGAVDLTDWVRLLASESRTIDCFDPALVGTERDREPPKGMDEMLALALKCISRESGRPNIRSVYEELTSISV